MSWACRSSVDVRDDGRRSAILERDFDGFREVDAALQHLQGDSEISRLNRGELAARRAHPDVREVLERCDELREETGGFFDVRAAVGHAVDPSGLVKGWCGRPWRQRSSTSQASGTTRSTRAATCVCGPARCPSRLARRASSTRLDRQHRGRRRRERPRVATSGAYARGDHVLDPHTGVRPSASSR